MVHVDRYWHNSQESITSGVQELILMSFWCGEKRFWVCLLFLCVFLFLTHFFFFQIQSSAVFEESFGPDGQQRENSFQREKETWEIFNLSLEISRFFSANTTLIIYFYKEIAQLLKIRSNIPSSVTINFVAESSLFYELCIIINFKWLFNGSTVI